MKKLYLIRHAKSSWDDPTKTDFERTLNHRGEKDAPLMAKFLSSKKIIPDLMISSPATRAFTTALFFASQFEYPYERIQTDERIYEATTGNLSDVVRQIADEYETVFIFGHNPGISNFCNLLTSKPVHDLPTCAVAGLDLNINSWSELNRYCGKLILFEYPKKLRMDN
jgi:phosphohistidine phosphatase